MNATRSEGLNVPFEAQYAAALAAYIDKPAEALLHQAYELGRSALVQGRNIPDVVAVHARALTAIVDGSGATNKLETTLCSATAFLADSLSPFEMTHRGYREAIVALRHLNETLEREVKHIAHALHDEAGQLMVSVHLALADLEREIPTGAHQLLLRVREALTRTETELRQLSHELRPTVLDDLGWLPALEFLADGVSKRAQLPVHVRSDIGQRLPSNIETAIYRVVQEALTNATRHANASCIHIEISRKSGELCCLISDDGAGFDPDVSAMRGGLGLKGMLERMRAVNGRLRIDSRPGYGTQIRLFVPLGT